MRRHNGREHRLARLLGLVLLVGAGLAASVALGSAVTVASTHEYGFRPRR